MEDRLLLPLPSILLLRWLSLAVPVVELLEEDLWWRRTEAEDLPVAATAAEEERRWLKMTALVPQDLVLELESPPPFPRLLREAEAGGERWWAEEEEEAQWCGRLRKGGEGTSANRSGEDGMVVLAVVSVGSGEASSLSVEASLTFLSSSEADMAVNVQAPETSSSAPPSALALFLPPLLFSGTFSCSAGGSGRWYLRRRQKSCPPPPQVSARRQRRRSLAAEGSDTSEGPSMSGERSTRQRRGSRPSSFTLSHSPEAKKAWKK